MLIRPSHSRMAIVTVIQWMQPDDLIMKEMTQKNPAVVSLPSDFLRGIVIQLDDLPSLLEGRSNKQIAGF